MRHFPFRVSVRTSRNLITTILVAHTVAAFVAISLVDQSWLKVLLLLGIGASSAYCRRPQDYGDYSFRPDGKVEYLPSVVAASAEIGRAGSPNALAQVFDVDATSRVLGHMMIVRFRHTPASRSLILLPDSFDHPDDYRRVRLWLKWQGKGNATDDRDDLPVGTQDSI